MTCRLLAVSFDSADPLRLARFWGDLLGWKLTAGPQEGAALVPGHGAGFGFQFLPALERKSGQNERHFKSTLASAPKRAISCSPTLKATNSA
jgi:hypothetical protein